MTKWLLLVLLLVSSASAAYYVHVGTSNNQNNTWQNADSCAWYVFYSDSGTATLTYLTTHAYAAPTYDTMFSVDSLKQYHFVAVIYNAIGSGADDIRATPLDTNDVSGLSTFDPALTAVTPTDTTESGGTVGTSPFSVAEADSIVSQTQRVADSLFAFGWRVSSSGSGTGPDTLELYVVGITGTDTAAIVGATVSYWEGATKHIARSDSTGLVTFGVTAGTYTCQAEDGHWYFAQESVSSPGVDTIFGTAPIVAGSSNPSQCVVYGQINVNGQAANRYWVEIDLTRSDTLTISDTYISYRNRVWTDSTGLWQARMYFLTGETAAGYYNYRDQTGRRLTFRPVDTTTVNINDVIIKEP